MTGFDFVYSDLDETYKWGSPNNGIGVYVENDKWFGNLVIQGDITNYGPFDSSKECFEALEDAYLETQIKGM